ncbi:hypothetical protein L7F22_002664 [Adiantum nelumboides]|nr:hypothetical protein [Adiantum nelumboides]
MLRELDLGELELDRCSHDREETEYGRYLTDMTTTHGLAILNGLQRFPGASGFTCFPHRHGASTVDYVMAEPKFIPCIQDFTVGARPVGIAVDHALLTFSVLFQYSIAQTSGGISHTRYSFTPETNSVYTEEIYSRLCTAGPGLSVEECTTLLTETLHGAALEAYPHTQPGRRQHSGSMPQNSWYYYATITEFDNQKKAHKVVYDNGQTEVLDMEREIWELDTSGILMSQRFLDATNVCASEESFAAK